MEKKNMKEWMGKVMSDTTRIAIPIMTHPGIELSGRKVIDAVTDGEVHAEAIVALNQKYPASASTVIMDLTVEAEAFGAEVVFPEDEVPSVTGRLLHNYKEVEALQIPSLDGPRVQEYLKANQMVAEMIDDKPSFGGCIGPFSLAGRLFDMTEIMMAIYTEPETITLLLKKCTSFITSYCRAMKERGAAGVIIAEPAAGLISNEDCSEFSSKYVKEIVDKVQDDHFMVVLHNCGNTGHCTQAMLEAGAMAYHFGNKIDITEALKQCPEDVLVMGNLDPVGLFKQASAAEVKETTREMLKVTSSWKNYILSSGCDVPPHTPLENIEAFYEALEEYNQTRN